MRRLIFILVLITAGANILHAQHSAIGYFNPDWSPDGKRIAFESTKSGKYAIYTIKTDGTDLQKLTGDESDNGQARWSPDGKRIVF